MSVDEVTETHEEVQHTPIVDEPLQNIDAPTDVPKDFEEQVEEHTTPIETFEPSSNTDIVEDVGDSNVETSELERSVDESMPDLPVEREVTDEDNIPTEHGSPIEAVEASSTADVVEDLDDSNVEGPQVESSVEESVPALCVEREVVDEHSIATDVDVPKIIKASPEINEEIAELGVDDVVDNESEKVHHGNESIVDEDTTLVHTDAPFTDLSDKVTSEEHVYETGPVKADDNLTSDYIMEGDTMLNVPEGIDIILLL
jgi:hypothetical protein